MSEKSSGHSLRLEEMLPVVEEKLKNGGAVVFSPHGTSMLPLIRQGKDSVRIERLDRKARVGDVVFYRRHGGQFVLHRIIGKDKLGFILCGDNQWIKEKGVSDDQIIGMMTAVIRDGETISCNNAKYRRYVRRLPLRRMNFRKRNFIARVKSKIKRTLGL